MTAVLTGITTPVLLTLGIARLGEADLFGWWRSRGLSEAGQFVLGDGLPRTWRLAALEGAVLSAAARHEEIFGRPDALHLFSDQLPAKRLTLNWLRERKVEGDNDGLLSELGAWTKARALERLREWASVPPRTGEVLGQGRRLGSLSRAQLEADEPTRGVIRELAAAYAIEPEHLRYPYFDLGAS